MIGFALAAIAVAVPALLAFDFLAKWQAVASLLSVVRALGLVGALSFLIGTVVAARARHAARTSSWLAVGAIFWAAEFVLRILDTIGEGPSPGSITARAVLAGAGGATLAMGMLTLLPPANFRSVRDRWKLVRTSFGAQLLVFIALPLIARLFDTPISDWVDSRDKLSPTVGALLWIVFAAPHIQFWFCLRSTQHAMVRRDSISDILLS